MADRVIKEGGDILYTTNDLEEIENRTIDCIISHTENKKIALFNNVLYIDGVPFHKVIKHYPVTDSNIKMSMYTNYSFYACENKEYEVSKVRSDSTVRHSASTCHRVIKFTLYHDGGYFGFGSKDILVIYFTLTFPTDKPIPDEEISTRLGTVRLNFNSRNVLKIKE